MLSGPLLNEKKKILKLLNNKSKLHFLLSCQTKYEAANYATNPKNEIDSSNFRSEGNQLFTSSKNIITKNSLIKDEILELYSKSISFAPNDSNELALGYGNRSALLFHLKEYEKCLSDLNEALSLPLSNLQKLKYMVRKLDCLITLQKPECQSFCEQLKPLLEQGEDIDAKIRNKFKGNVGMENIIPHAEIPLFSNKVDIAYDSKYGIHVKAARDIKPGEILCEQDIYVIFPQFGFTYIYCSNCYKFTMNSIPCKNCAQAVYCSIECKNKSWKQYHDIECNLIHRTWHHEEELDPCSVLAIRILILALRETGSISELENVVKDIEDWQGNIMSSNLCFLVFNVFICIK